MEQAQEEARKGGSVTPIRKEFTPAKFSHEWVPSKNERNFHVFLDVLAMGEGEGRQGALVSEAGNGKTTTVKRHVGQNQDSSVYLLCLEIWNGSPIPLLRALCREVGVADPPRRKDDCWLMLADRLIREPRTIFLDEADMIPKQLNVVRQLCEATGSLIVLVGESNLITRDLIRNKRTWSRTFQVLSFEPVTPADVILYGRKTAGLDVTPEAAAVIREATGDWRVVKRTTIDLVEIANAKQTRTVSEEMAKLALKMGLRGVAAQGKGAKA